MMATISGKKEIQCKFSGGCGSSFLSETEYLRHVVKHLRNRNCRILYAKTKCDMAKCTEADSNFVIARKGIRGTTATEIVQGFREHSKNLTDDRFAFDCLIPRRILATYNREKANQLETLQEVTVTSLEDSSNQTIQIQLGAATSPHYGFPVYELVLNRFQSQQDDLIPSASSLVKMEDVLPHITSCESQLAAPVNDPVKIDKVNWNELLQNFPSATDDLSPSDIVKLAASKPIAEIPESTPKLNYGKNYASISTQDYGIRSRVYPRENARYDQDCGLDEKFSCRTRLGYPPGGRGKDMNRLRLVMTPTQRIDATRTGTQEYLRSHVHANQIGGKQGSRYHPFSAARFRQLYSAIGRRQPSSFGMPKSKSKRFKRKLNISGEYYSSEYILEEGLKKKRASGVTYLKPYVCPVPKCGKSYKNANGIKYHAKYGHSAPQQFPCHCGKLYSTMHSLLAHKKTHAASSSCSSDSTTDDYETTSDSDQYHSESSTSEDSRDGENVSP